MYVNHFCIEVFCDIIDRTLARKFDREISYFGSRGCGGAELERLHRQTVNAPVNLHMLRIIHCSPVVFCSFFGGFT